MKTIFSPQFCSTRRWLTNFGLLLLLLCSAQAQAAIQWQVYIDTNVDEVPPVGCQVDLDGTLVEGIDVIVITTVDANVITGVSRQVCQDPNTNSFAPPEAIDPGGWPVGLGLGVDTTDVFESFISLADIPTALGHTSRLYFRISDDATADQDVLVTVDGDPNAAPMLLNLPAPVVATVPTMGLVQALILGLSLALVGVLLLRRKHHTLVVSLFAIGLLSSGIGVLWAAIVTDGSITDWDGITPIGSDPPDNTAPDLRDVYAVVMDQKLYLRADVHQASTTLANDDDPGGVAAYQTPFETPLSVADGPTTDPVERNDNLGFPVATLSHFGGADASADVTDNVSGSTITPLPQGGGSLTMNADGSFDFTPPTGFLGNYQFLYRLTQGAATSDATVTIAVTKAPVANADNYQATLDTVLSRSTADADDLLDNDERNFPVANLASFGGGSLPGDASTNTAGSTVNFGADGTLTVNADGSFSFKPVTGFLGNFTFDYTLTSSEGSSTATVTIEVKPLVGSIVVVKDSVPNDAADFSYSVATTTATPVAPFSLDDDNDAALPNTRTFDDLEPGTYTITEGDPSGAGFQLTALSANDPDNGSSTNLGGRNATVDLDGGETVTVTFTNTKLGSVTITKDAVPNVGTDFAFTNSDAGIGNFSLDDDADPGLPNTRTFSGLLPGSYAVTETNPGADYHTTLACTDPSGGTTTANRTATIGLAAGESVSCTYTNAKLGSVTITKDTAPDAATDFAFTSTSSTSSSIGSFSLDDDADPGLPNTRTFSGLLSGSYTVTETDPGGGYTTTIVCTDPSGGTTTAGRTATISLTDGENVSCTFTNSLYGSITIIKDTVPDATTNFSFTGSGAIGSFTLDDDTDGTLSNTQTINNLLPGTYTVTEADPGSSYATAIVCTDPSGGTTTASRVASIDLAGGENVSCTYTNTLLGNITISKDAVPNAATDFSFTGSGAIGSFTLDDDSDGTLPNTLTFSGLTPGAYTVSESNPGSGYITGINCTDPSGGTTSGGLTANIGLAGGETVSCTFTNTATVAPTANDDPNGGLPANSTPAGDTYHTYLNTQLSVPNGGEDLLANDSLGVPNGTITSFDNASTQGGTVAVSGDGSFTYDPPSATFTGTDTFTYTLGNVVGSDGATVTVAVGERPACTNDSYDTIGNVGITVSANGVLGNDSGDQIHVTEFEGTINVGATLVSDNGGIVTLNADGSFTYDPPVGYTGNDSFQYRAGNGFGDTAECNVSISVSNVVWFIDANGPDNPGAGTLASPFKTLAAFEAVNGNGGNNPAAGACIFIESGSYDSPLTLENNQIVAGMGTNVPLADADGGADTLCNIALNSYPYSNSLPAINGARPTLSNSGAGNGINLASDNSLRGFNIGNTPNGFGIAGGAVGSPKIAQVSISGTGGGIEVATSGAFGSNVLFDVLEAGGPRAGINLRGVTGTLGITSGGAGFNGASDSFPRVRIVAGSVSFTYPGNVTQSRVANLVEILGGHTGTITFQSGTLNAPNGAGLDFNDADGTYNFLGSTVLEGPDSRVFIHAGSSGTFNFGSGTSIVDSLGNTYYEDSSPANVTFSGTIVQTNNQAAVNINNKTGGTTTFQNNAAPKDIVANTSTGIGINLTNNAGGTINFEGTLDIDTTTATGFSASGGGVVTATGPGSTINTTTGRGVNITDTTIGAGGISFMSVATTTSAGVPGIRLFNTGAGPFSVLGDGTTGGSLDGSNNGSGGQISNRTGNTNAVELTNTGPVTIQQMVIGATGALGNVTRNGILADGIAALTVRNTDFINVANEAFNVTTGDEAAILLINPNAGMNVTLDNNLFNRSWDDHVRIENARAGVTNGLAMGTISASQNYFNDNDASGQGNDALLYIGENNSFANIVVQSNQFFNSDGDHVQVAINGAATADVTIGGAGALGNTTDSNGLGFVVGSGMTMNSGQGLGFIDFSTAPIFRFNTNSVQNSVNGGAINVYLTENSSVFARYNVHLNNNVVGTDGDALSGGFGIRNEQNGEGNYSLISDHNQVHEYDGDWGYGLASKLGSGHLDATVTNDLVTDDTPAVGGDSFLGVGVDLGASASATNQVCFDAHNNDWKDADGSFGDIGFGTSSGSGLTIVLPGYAGGATDGAAVQSFIQANNVGSPTVGLFLGSAGDQVLGTGSSCLQPAN